MVKAPSRRNPEAVIRERAHIVGDSGKVYMELAEKGDEIVQLIPVKGPFKPKREKGKQKAATGAELLALGIDPGSAEAKRMIESGAVKYDTPIASVKPPTTSAPPQVASSVSVTNPNPTRTGYGAAGTAQHQAAQGVQTAQQADLEASRAVNAAQQRQLEANRSVIAAASNSDAAARRALQGETEYLNLQERLAAEAKAAEEGIQAAQANTADKVAVAQAQRARESSDYQYGIAGLTAPKEVSVASGTNLPPGVRAAFESQEDLLRRDESNAAAMRAFEGEAGRIATARTRAESQAADLEANNAQRVAQAMGLDVDAARLGADLAGLNVRQAQLDYSKSTTPPQPGQVYDPDTGTFVNSQAELDMLNAGRSIVQDPTTGQLVTRSDLLSRTDTLGNVKRASDGVWVDPRTGNEYVNGQWYDPQSGNVRMPDPLTGQDTWVSPSGLVLRGSRWWDSEGYYLQSDGSFYNPMTGQTKFEGQGFLSSGGYLNETIREIDRRASGSGGSLSLDGAFD